MNSKISMLITLIGSLLFSAQSAVAGTIKICTDKYHKNIGDYELGITLVRNPVRNDRGSGSLSLPSTQLITAIKGQHTFSSEGQGFCLYNIYFSAGQGKQIWTYGLSKPVCAAASGPGSTKYIYLSDNGESTTNDPNNKISMGRSARLAYSPSASTSNYICQ